MARLYAITASARELTEYFGIAADAPIPLPVELTEERVGLVVRERHGGRVLQAMGWGFPRRPRLPVGGREGPARIGLVADLTNPMWERVVVEPRYRCLISLTHWANPDGPPRRRTRTWFSVINAPIAAWAGLWRDSSEWGPVYSGAMTDCNEAIRPVHDRMPVLLMPDEYDTWLHGDLDTAAAFQDRCFSDDLILMERTAELWVKRKPATTASPEAGTLL